MPDSTRTPPSDPINTAYQDGRRFGLATGALALSIVAFLNMFGMEKSILAIVLALLALQGAEPMSAAFRRSRTALVVAGAHIITIVVVLVLFHDKITSALLQLLQKLH
jgi:hypothetical protein